MFDRELDYYVITANNNCITTTERIIDKSKALALRVDVAKRGLEKAQSVHETFLLALECYSQFCQGKGAASVKVVIPKGHGLHNRSGLSSEEDTLFKEFLGQYFGLEFMYGYGSSLVPRRDGCEFYVRMKNSEPSEEDSL